MTDMMTKSAERADAGERREFELPHGLPGFPAMRRFALEDGPAPETPFKLMRSVDDPEFSLLVLPAPLEGGFHANGALLDEAKKLEIAPDHLAVLVVVNARKEEDKVAFFANLRAPIFIDAQSGLGAQIVLANPDYPVRTRLG